VKLSHSAYSRCGHPVSKPTLAIVTASAFIVGVISLLTSRLTLPSGNWPGVSLAPRRRAFSR